MGRKLKVWLEEHGKAEGRARLEHSADLKRDAMPFDQRPSGRYHPPGSDGFAEVLISCTRQQKSSPMIQIAGLMLFPVCRGCHDREHRAYQTPARARPLIAHPLRPDGEDIRGIRYSCLDAPEPKR